MHRPTLLVVALMLALLPGCGRPAPDARPPVQVQVEPKAQPVAVPAAGEVPAKPPAAPATPQAAPEEKQAKYEAALNDALELMADRKLPEALVALQAARELDDNDFVRGEIAKLKQRLDQESAGKATVQSIETVLAEGKAVQAAQLTTQALQEFGGGSDAPALVKLRIQADALASVQKDEDAPARHARFRAEGEAALAEKNLRAAALAFEQAVLARADAAVQQKLDDVRARLEKYDALRARAAELRKDGTRLEEAVAALREAQQAWDTLPVRQDLDEYTLALQKRRDTVSVADFDVRAELGVPDLGRTVAEELLPLFKPRFDLVERGQVAKVLAELKLEQGPPDDPAQQRELGRLAKVRYLVLGSVYPLAGVTIQARLVDVQTGLVVQTARVAAPTAAEAIARAPELARQLMMTDAEKMAYDAAVQEKVARAPVVFNEDAPLPPPPPPLPAGAPPPADVPDVVQLVPPPPAGGLRLEAFAALPPPAAGVALVAPPADPVVEVRLKRRLLQAAVRRGDFFVRVGNGGEAQRQFELALALAPGDVDVQLRIDRVRPLVPPPPPPQLVVVAPPPPVVARPRIAVLNFVVAGDPLVVPPALGAWTPQQLAPYVAAGYDVVDPALVYWYMGSLGMTMNDLLTDPSARRWLGRAVGARSFLLGTIEQTASFDVSTYLVDAEFGYLQGSARLHVRDAFELRLRLGELAELTLMDPLRRQQLLAQAQAFDALVRQGRDAIAQADFAAAVRCFDDALRLRPGAIEVRVYRHRARHLARQRELEEQRRQYLLAQAAAFAEAQRRQRELAEAAEQARLLALQQAAARAEADRLLLAQQRAQAQNVLIQQAQVSFQTRNFTFSVNIYESAVAFAPPPAAAAGPAPVPAPAVDPYRELARARLEAVKQAQLVQAQFVARQEADLRQQREAELTAARRTIAEQQRQLEAQRQAQLEKDRQTYARALAEGQAQLSKGNYGAAVGALQVAQRLQRTPAVDRLLELAGQRQAEAQARTDAERKALEAKLDAERARRRQAEEEAKRNQERYTQALKQASDALARKDLATAQAQFEAAGAVFKTDVVASGLKQVAQARAQQQAAVQQQQAESAKAAQVQTLLAQGQAALKQQQHAQAVQAFQAAQKLAPQNLDVLAGLTQAEQLHARQDAEARQKADDAHRLDSFQRLLKGGQANLAGKQYDAAVANLTEALKLRPGDAAATAALKQAEAGRAAVQADAQAQAAARQKLAAYQKALADGRLALGAKRYDDAIAAFAEAQRQMPGDAATKDFLAQAQKGKQDAADAVALLARKKAEQQKLAEEANARTARVQALVKSARAALAGKDLAAAAKALGEAGQLDPANPAVQQAQRDLDQARAAEAGRQKQLAAYQSAVAAGQKALAAKNYPDAIRSLGEAAKLLPGDVQATALLQQAQQAQADAQRAQDEAARQKLEQARQAQLAALLKDGNARLAARQFADAKTAFQAALKLVPNDPAAQHGLQQASQGLEPPRTAPPSPPSPPVKPTPPAPPVKDNKALYAKAMQDAAALEKQQKFADAAKTYQEALQLMPNDAPAATGVRRAQFGQHVADGQRYLDAMRFADAAREFEAALKLSPGNPQVQKLLDRARQMKK